LHRVLSSTKVEPSHTPPTPSYRATALRALRAAISASPGNTEWRLGSNFGWQDL